MFDWIKKHIILICFILAIIIFGIPFLIHILFKIDSGIPFFQAEWTAGDILGYHGSVLSFIGTVALGVLALHQNDIIKEEADKRSNLIEQREYERNMPRFKIAINGSNGQASFLWFLISNISENNATDVTLYDIFIFSSKNEIFWKSEMDYSYDRILANDFVRGQLGNPPLREDGYIFSMKMTCNDKYNKPHAYTIYGVYHSKNKFPKLEITESK